MTADEGGPARRDAGPGDAGSDAGDDGDDGREDSSDGREDREDGETGADDGWRFDLDEVGNEPARPPLTAGRVDPVNALFVLLGAAFAVAVVLSFVL